MGCQVSISMLRQDEDAFLSFLRETADVRILRPFAPSEEQLFIADFSVAHPEEFQFFLYNTAFLWEPRFLRVANDAQVVERRGFTYCASMGSAPVLEYDRKLYKSAASPGRLYWGEKFAAPDGLAYDVIAFKRWYDHAAAWLTKHGRRIPTDPDEKLYLPAAYAAVASTA